MVELTELQWIIGAVSAVVIFIVLFTALRSMFKRKPAYNDLTGGKEAELVDRRRHRGDGEVDDDGDLVVMAAVISTMQDNDYVDDQNVVHFDTVPAPEPAPQQDSFETSRISNYSPSSDSSYSSNDSGGDSGGD